MPDWDLDCDLLALLPPWYREILDYQQLCLAEGEQFGTLAGAVRAVADNFYFQTMNEAGIAEWEQAFGILANSAVEELEFRRLRLQNRISIKPPFSLGFLYQKLDEIIGKNRWTVAVDYPNYTLYVESSAGNQEYAVEVAFTINKIKPAHILYVNRPLVLAGLRLQEEIEQTKRIFNYRLGAWGLGSLPFAESQPLGVIKMADTPSIDDNLLDSVAGFVAEEVAAALINDTVRIEALTKEVNGSTLSLSYAVTASQAETVSAVALVNAAGDILTSAAVYVPITDTVVIKHTIPVKEGGVNNG